MDITALFTGLVEGIKALGGIAESIFGFAGKGKVDETEAMKQYYLLQLKIAELESFANQLRQATENKLIDLEQSVAARWRTPLILTSGGALVMVAVNNIVAAVYFSWAHPVDMVSAPMLVLAGMFLLLVTGSAELLMEVFRGKSKLPDNKDSPVKSKQGG